MVVRNTRWLALLTAMLLNACPTIRRGPVDGSADGHMQDGRIEEANHDAASDAHPDGGENLDGANAPDGAIADAQAIESSIPDATSMDTGMADGRAMDAGLDASFMGDASDSSAMDSVVIDTRIDAVAMLDAGFDAAEDTRLADASAVDTRIDSSDARLDADAPSEDGPSPVMCPISGPSLPTGCTCINVPELGGHVVCSPYTGTQIGQPYARPIVSLDAARSACSDINGTLLYPRSAGETEQVRLAIAMAGLFPQNQNDQRMWLDVMRDSQQATRWIVPGRGLTVASTQNTRTCFGQPTPECPWNPGEPSSLNEWCLEVIVANPLGTARLGGWNDTSCFFPDVSGNDWLRKFLVCRVTP